MFKNEYLEPLGIMYLSSYLKKHGHETFFLDLQFEKDLFKAVRKISPDLIAYSITTGLHHFYRKLNLKLKDKFKFFAFFGGAHCTYVPDFVNEEGVDAICRGEGEIAMLELVNKLEKGEDITKIKNLFVKKDGKIYKNEMGNFIHDLNEMPFPDREGISKYNHYSKMKRRFVMTGRGCPYDCSYCCNHSLRKLYDGKGTGIRRRSKENVLKELRIIKDVYKPKSIVFADDTFIMNRDWILDFLKIYKEEIGIPFDAQIRVNLVNEEMIKALKEAGCITVRYGVENGNERMRNEILKKNISVEQILNTSKLCRKYKIKNETLNIVGLPDETMDMAFQTLALNIKCNPEYAWMSVFQPYPATELWNYAKEKGYFDGDVNKIGEDFYDKSVMKLKDIKKMERFRCLFSYGVSFPFLVPLIRVLVHLPLNKIYLMLWLFHRSYNYLFKFKFLYPSELFIRE